MCRCVLQCQDEVKDKVSLKNLKIVCFCCPLSVTQTQLLSFKVGPNTPESEMRKFRGEFETCAIACCDKWLLKAKMINMWLLKCWLLDKCLIVEIVAKLTFPSQVNQQDAQPVDQAQGCFWEWKTLASLSKKPPIVRRFIQSSPIWSVYLLWSRVLPQCNIYTTKLPWTVSNH